MDPAAQSRPREEPAAEFNSAPYPWPYSSDEQGRDIGFESSPTVPSQNVGLGSEVPNTNFGQRSTRPKGRDQAKGKGKANASSSSTMIVDNIQLLIESNNRPAAGVEERHADMVHLKERELKMRENDRKCKRGDKVVSLMSMDCSKMTPRQAKYWSDKREEIATGLTPRALFQEDEEEEQLTFGNSADLDKY